MAQKQSTACVITKNELFWKHFPKEICQRLFYFTTSLQSGLERRGLSRNNSPGFKYVRGEGGVWRVSKQLAAEWDGKEIVLVPLVNVSVYGRQSSLSDAFQYSGLEIDSDDGEEAGT